MTPSRRMLLLRLILHNPNTLTALEKIAYAVQHEWLRLAGVQEDDPFIEKVPYPSAEEFKRKYNIDWPPSK